MSKLLCFKVAIAWMVVLIASASWAQCGVTQDCTPNSRITLPNICSANMCFVDAGSKIRYEQKNNCIFLDGSRCNGKDMNTETKCCVKDAKTGKSKPREKQHTELDKNFKWDIYAKECEDMQQSHATPDGLWAQCKVGQKHSVSDDYPVARVEQNGSARSYCIDGCSTPPKAVSLAVFFGSFIFADRNNPTGAGSGGVGNASSFLSACSEHDKCYQTCNSNNQQTCDNEMLSNMRAVCAKIPEDHTTIFDRGSKKQIFNTHDACLSAANTMHTGLKYFGSDAFSLRRQQYCQCCRDKIGLPPPVDLMSPGKQDTPK
ncbi:hypothetical protein [Verminephrobacter aporrectodeae]|uniref:hypothetical protein n=1 Tax=Verminephrobacter aporrectodeae TaxID=1110389 RepID=UPI002237C04B|nr:hypothetical protein [Verminephrobacter aporrectodeae]